MIKRILSTAVAVIMLLGLAAACGASATRAPSSGASGQSSSETLATITYYEENTNTPGPYTGFRARAYEKYGLKVEYILASVEQTQALLASGNLPDVMRFRSKEELETAISGNMLVNLNDYADNLTNTIKYTGPAVEYSKQNLSMDSGNWYVVLFSSTNNAVGPYAVTWGTPMYVRWDLYTAIGRPVADKFEDLIPIYKAMQDIEPETADGRKTYAVAMFTQWDGNGQFNQSGITMLGYTGTYLNQNNMCYDTVNKRLVQNSSKDSPYYRTMKFYNQLQQNGLLDPDSITQDWNTVNEKLAAGVYVAHFNSGNVAGYNTLDRNNADTPNGYVPLLFNEYKAVKSPVITLGNTPGQFCGISAKAKDIDACIRFLEAMADPDMLLTLFNGEQGDMWDIVNNDITPTQKYWDWLDKGGDYIFNDGEVRKEVFIRYSLAGAFLHPAYNGPLDLVNHPDVIKAKNSTKLMDEWASVYGAINQREYAIDNNINYTEPYACYFMPAAPDNLTSIKASVGDLVVDSFWRMIYSNSDEEFEAMWDQMESDVKALGGDQLWDWGQEAFAEAVKIAQANGQFD